MRAGHLTFLAGLCAAGAWAHGLIESPPSRNWICGQASRPDEIDNGIAPTPACSVAYAANPLAAYNYMAVLTHGPGRDSVSPPPAHVCGFAGETWRGAQTPWDVPMDWPTTPMAPGPQAFTWNITWGPHFDDTRDFKYWITKPGFVFSPTRALAWDDFETEPFCTARYDDRNPSATPETTVDKAKARITNRCTLPARTGHHVIYAEWGRSWPTLERFHGCVDGAFGTGARLKQRKPRERAAPIRAWAGPDGRPRDARGSVRE